MQPRSTPDNPAARTPECPSDDDIDAFFVSGPGESGLGIGVREHLQACEFCVARMRALKSVELLLTSTLRSVNGSPPLRATSRGQTSPQVRRVFDEVFGTSAPAVRRQLRRWLMRRLLVFGAAITTIVMLLW